jgi:hypothetical protein
LWPNQFGFQVDWNDGDGGFEEFVAYTVPGYSSAGYFSFTTVDIDLDGDRV